MSQSWPWKCHALSVAGGKAEVPSAKCLESGCGDQGTSFITLFTTTPTCSPSVCPLLVLVLVETPCLTTVWEQRPFKRWQDLQSCSKPVTDGIHIIFRCYKAQQVVPVEFCIHNLLMSWSTASARSRLSLSELLCGRRAVVPFSINITTCLLTPSFSHRNPMPCMSCRWISETYISLEAFS